MLMVAAAVLVHELGHIFVARTIGVKVWEVEFFPFGGQAKIEDFTGLHPDREIYVALAGPAASLFTAVVFYFLTGKNLHYFVKVNLLLAAFNMLPALPLDGGRILRAFLSRLLGYRKATQAAAFSGVFLAFLLMVCGGYCMVYGDLRGVNYAVIGGFLFWGAQREKWLLNYAFMRFLVNKKRELAGKGFMKSRQLVSYPDTEIKKILSTLKPEEYTLVVVVDKEQHILGMCGEAELIECILNKGPSATLKDL
ncbi:stage IV sporulation protein FB [Thermosyntropha lipolytica DSM 11003]|uniref:Stage IV sporulation protein FB n=1 Tax=Thermosyntropha lipolytica DSM 11003 TaxID=1123382 RepID=A0A1M5MNG3_9FIRM|nr:M50 family metallopeptidase [Thermosyntropha lipolytica]SHG78811.1 stage IV sporulation protein FB [Thermosyntropha lipolytica DSM 11003]